MDQQTDELEEDENSASNQKAWVLAGTILASSMAFIDGSALNVALPVIQSDLHANGEQLLWITNAYLLMLAALILIGGSLGDKLGRKRVFMGGIMLFLLGSSASGATPGVHFLIGARFIQGIGGAAMIPGSLAIITTAFPSEERGQAIGTWSAVTTLVTVAGPALGGFLAGNGLWRGVFLINIPIGIIALFILHFKIEESFDQESSKAVDYLGALLAVIGLSGLAYGFISAPNRGVTNPLVYGSLAIGTIGIIAFVIIESHSNHPMVPLSIFQSQTFSGSNLLTLFLYGALNVLSFFFSLNLVQAQGYSPSLAGLAFTPFAVLLATESRWAGKLSDRFGPRLPLIVGPFLAGLGFLWMGFVGLSNGPIDYWTTFFPGIIVFGIGMGITVAPLTNTVMGSAASHLAGTASGINNAVSRTAGVLAIAIVGSIALFIFGNALQTRSSHIDLSIQARQALQSQAKQLGEASVPSQVSTKNVDAVKMAIRLAFVDTFQVVMFICAGLAWLSMLMAVMFIKGQITPAG